jgi:hypothetical protein
LSGRFRLLFALFEAERIIAGFQDITVVGDAIQQGCRHLGIAENRYPFGKRQIGGDDQGGLFVKLTDQVEQQSAAGGRERQISQFIEVARAKRISVRRSGAFPWH